MIVTLIGPVKFWWDCWDSPQHKQYVSWRNAVSQALVDAGHLVYRPHEAFKGQWTESAQVVNDVAIRTSDVLLNLSPPHVYSFGSDDEIEYARRYNKTVLDLPCPSLEGQRIWLSQPDVINVRAWDEMQYFVATLDDIVASKRGLSDENLMEVARQLLHILDSGTPQNSLSRETVIQRARDLTGVNTPEKKDTA